MFIPTLIKTSSNMRITCRLDFPFPFPQEIQLKVKKIHWFCVYYFQAQTWIIPFISRIYPWTNMGKSIFWHLQSRLKICIFIWVPQQNHVLTSLPRTENAFVNFSENEIFDCPGQGNCVGAISDVLLGLLVLEQVLWLCVSDLGCWGL